MARIHEDAVVIKMSTLVRDDAEVAPFVVPDEMVAAIEEIVGTFLGTTTVVEIFQG